MRSILKGLVCWLLAAGLLASLPAAAQQQETAAPAKAAQTKAAAAKPAADPLQGFDEWTAERMKEWKVPGAAIAIVRDGQVIYARGFGHRDVEKQLPVTPDTLFAIGSTTKAITATGLGILVSEGKLDWDKPLVDYLPDFKMSDPYVTANFTPRDLVTHRSGLPRHDLLWYQTTFSRRELFDRLRYLEPSRGFRSQYQYQNLMFMTAGLLIEKLSGRSWEEFTRQRFLEPLGMKTTNFSVRDSERAADFAWPYGEEKDEVKRIPFRNIDAVGPAGSVNSSVNEMAQWVRANLARGKIGDKQVIPEAAFREPHTPQVVVPGPMQYDELSYGTYGMGWAIHMYRGHLRLSHGGGIDGFTALVSMLPRKNIGLVILTNRGGTPLPGILANNIYDRLLGLEPVDWNGRTLAERDRGRAEQERRRAGQDSNRKKDTRPSVALAEFAGKYEHPGYGTLTVANEGDSLQLSYYGLKMELRHYHFDVFEESSDGPQRRKVTFSLNGRGEIERLAVPLEPAVSEIVFKRVPEAPPLERAALEKLTGEFEIMPGAGVKIWLRDDGALMMTAPAQPDYELVRARGFTFGAKNLPAGYSVEFRTDENGAATAIVMHQPNGVFTLKRK
jgi:CubicO group peptidase (beta-lactamase class C family)